MLNEFTGAPLRLHRQHLIRTNLFGRIPHNFKLYSFTRQSCMYRHLVSFEYLSYKYNVIHTKCQCSAILGRVLTVSFHEIKIHVFSTSLLPFYPLFSTSKIPFFLFLKIFYHYFISFCTIWKQAIRSVLFFCDIFWHESPFFDLKCSQNIHVSKKNIFPFFT